MDYSSAFSGSAIAAAVNWIEATLLGSVATAIATIAVGAIGYLAFMGRIDLRRGTQVILGCFVLFGAPMIAAGLQGLASGFFDQPEIPTASSLVNAAPKVELPKPVEPSKRAAPGPYVGVAIASD